MKKRYFFMLIVGIITTVFGCRLDPQPAPQTFDVNVNIPSGYTLFLIDGIQLENGELIVIGNAKKNDKQDLFVGRLDIYGKTIDSKVFDSGGDEEVKNICRDAKGDLYVVGRNKDSKKGVIFKLTTQSKAIDTIKIRRNIELKEGCEFTRINIIGGNIYISYGALPGIDGIRASSCGFISFDTTLFSAKPNICMGDYFKGTVLASEVVNNKLLIGGVTYDPKCTNGGAGVGHVYSAGCITPKYSCGNINTSFNFISNIVTTSNGAVYGIGNLLVSGNLFKSFIVRIDIPTLEATATGQYYKFPMLTKDQVDSTIGKKAISVKSATKSADDKRIISALYFEKANGETGTMLMSFNVLDIGLAGATNKFQGNPLLAINTESTIGERINNTGYFLIGNYKSTPKVMKVNVAGKLGNL